MERDNQRYSYPRYDRNYDFRYDQRRVKRKKKHNGVSLLFCWGFGLIVCLTFGLASFMMVSAGHFSFSPDIGVSAAEGGSEGNENFAVRGLLKVDETELEPAKDFQQINEELYAQAENYMLEDFGPFPQYLSDYESIKLTAQDNGTKISFSDDDDEEFQAEISESNSKNDVLLSENAGAYIEHIVKSGETLSDIAFAHGNITVTDILRANLITNADKISEGELLLIPNDPSKVDETQGQVKERKIRVAANNEKIEPIKTKTYVVAQGDSLWSISSSNGIELDTLVGSNPSNKTSTSSRLRPGTELRIPNQEGIFYTMKKDETIEKVAKRYGVNMNKIRLVNVEIDVASLKAGDEIFLPGAKTEAVMENREPLKAAETKKPLPTPKVSKVPVKTETKNVKAEKPKPKEPEKPTKGEVAVKRTSGFRWPIMGRINSPFGWRQHPVTRRRDFHTGIDIKANRNDPIKAAGSGRVIYSGWMGGYGKVLVIEHPNGQSTLYAHCSTLLVGKGAGVSTGQLIAKIGTTGRSTGPHLHFEVRNGHSPVNPIKYLR